MEGRSATIAWPIDVPTEVTTITTDSTRPEPPGTGGSSIDAEAEAERLARHVVESGLELRLMGGMAIWLTSPSVRQPSMARRYADLDFVASSRERRRVSPFFEKEGYIPEKLFNALHGAQRLNFAHPSGRWTIDVVYDELHMSHKIDLRGRLNGPAATIPLADLLLTKLQIWQINGKDLRDILALLADHPIVEGAGGVDGIDLTRILALTGTDWGLCHTVERNLRLAADLRPEVPIDGAPFDPAEQVTTLLARIDAGPKSLAWRARARVGERVRWYEEPEEVRHLEPPVGESVPVAGGTPAPAPAVVPVKKEPGS